MYNSLKFYNMKQKLLALFLLVTSMCSYAQNSEFVYVENPLMPNFTYIMQDGLFYQIHEEPSDNNTFGKVLMVSYSRLKSYGAEVENPKGDIVIPTAIQNGDGDFADKYRVVYIDANFDDCDEITSIEFPKNVIMLQGVSFKNTKNLKKIEWASIRNFPIFPNFEGSGIEEVVIPDGVKYIASFMGSKIKKINIPATVTEVRSNAFKDCSALSTVAIPNSVAEIGNDAFNGCTALESIDVPSSVAKIGDRVFAGCSNLVEATIRGEIRRLANVFDNCENLKHIYLYASTPPRIYFQNMNATIHVPANSLSAYKADTYWRGLNIVGDL